MDLEPQKLLFVFYKKQDYEPFAVPFGFPVLRDINWKLELKKIDQSVSRSLENIILLITMGNEPEKGGINPRNLEAMKELFGSEAVGRVLVADYTTKAQFVIPDVSNIIGPQKYEIVNQDIKEGLQNIFFEDAKYSNSEIKIKVFFEKLKEGKKKFIREFLQPEIKKVCAELGFRDYPKVKFKSSTVLNEADIQKAAIRLTELGILTPKQSIESINEKELPDSTETGDGQEEYKNERKKGLFTPLVGGTPLYEEATKKDSGAPVAVPKKSVGRPTSKSIASEEVISAKAISDIAREASALEAYAKKHLMKVKKIKELSGEQENLIAEICKSVIQSNDIKDWKKTVSECFESISSIDKLIIKPEVLEIAEEYNVEAYQAAIIYHSRALNPEK